MMNKKNTYGSKSGGSYGKKPSRTSKMSMPKKKAASKKKVASKKKMK
jgi:hypothetical protein